MNQAQRQQLQNAVEFMKPHQLFPPSAEEIHHAVNDLRPLLQTKKRGAKVRPDQTSLEDFLS